jgi:FMN phosphatase YigB (HAD superfamily)
VIDTEFGHPKPDARIFEHAARQVGLARPNCFSWQLAFRRHRRGQSAGWTAVWLRGVGVPAPAPGDPVPDHTITCLSELLALPRVAQVLARQPIQPIP